MEKKSYVRYTPKNFNPYYDPLHFWKQNIRTFPLHVGFRLIVGYGAILLFLILTGCSTANLISEDRRKEWTPLQSEKSIQQLQQEVLRQVDPFNRYQRGKVMRVTASDIWNSTLIRWMTPLDRDNQKFQACLALYHQGIEYTFLNSEKKDRPSVLTDKVMNTLKPKSAIRRVLAVLYIWVPCKATWSGARR